QAGRQQVGERDVGGRVGAGIAQRDSEGDGVADVGRRVAHRLADGEVGPLGRLGGTGAVVAADRVELVAVADRGGGGLGAGAVHTGTDGQDGAGRAGQGADGPDASGAVVTADAGRGALEAEAGRDGVVDGDACGGVGAVVGQDHGEGDDVAHVGSGVA